MCTDPVFIIENLLRGYSGRPTIHFVPSKQKVFELSSVKFVGEQAETEQFYFENEKTLCAKRYAGGILVPTDAAVYGINIQTNLRGAINFHGYLHQSEGDIELYAPKEVPLKLRLCAKNGIFVNDRKQRRNDNVPVLTDEYLAQKARSEKKVLKVMGLKIAPNIETVLHRECQSDMLAIRSDGGSIQIKHIPDDEIPYYRFLD